MNVCSRCLMGNEVTFKGSLGMKVRSRGFLGNDGMFKRFDGN